MHQVIAELKATINDHILSLRSVSENEMISKPSPAKWSKKEILGHLVDSAQNNIRRFIVAQYEDEPQISYNQDKWVSITNYQRYNLSDLISLWYLLNLHICAILENADAEAIQRKSRTDDLHTIQWLAVDYIKHLKHHIHQVLDLEDVPYP
ncbi:MAG: DinB family protein [Chitinophagaceae bacterium]